ncbi:MAG: hypothetical protein FJ053_03955 [Cyanobacteria bacterium M_surface_10_m1_298]|nr:hypothetical protein [Cyanobacteria bacterium M_surface_10_m1_298]
MAFHPSRGRRLTLAALAATAALMPQLASAHPREFLQTNSWDSVVQDYPAPPIRQPRRWRANRDYAYGSDQVYREAPLTAEQVAQRCNIGRLLGGLGGGAAAYAMSRDDGRAWAIPLGALLGSQMGCSTASGRGPLPW